MAIFRSRAPFRIGLAGGGTDVSPYSDEYGGAILNATIDLFAHATIKPRSDGKIVMRAVNRKEFYEGTSAESIPINGELDLQKGVYNRVVKQFVGKPLSFELVTCLEVPSGSGLGTSSTLAVAILGAFVEWLKLPLGEYDIAHLAYEIERQDLAMAGGKQDQYAATFGGFNFMEFSANDKVIVNPLRLKDVLLHEMEHNLLLYYTETSRLSAKIIESQSANVTARKDKAVEAMHQVKKQAFMMKEAILTGRLDEIGDILDFGWQHKKDMASGISNAQIDEMYSGALNAGATGGKISGAGGGGFMIFYCPENSRYDVSNVLEELGGTFKRYHFTDKGLTTWTI